LTGEGDGVAFWFGKSIGESSMGQVLVIEDDVETRLLLRRLLEAGGFTVDAVWSGEKGLQAASSGRFDCLVLDLMMPDIDGFAVIEKLRAAEVTRRLPIVVLTVLDDDQSRIRALQAGADVYLQKPVNSKTLLESVWKLLEGRKP
jgi:DNA-binding response OmpR family regulator